MIVVHRKWEKKNPGRVFLNVYVSVIMSLGSALAFISLATDAQLVVLQACAGVGR